ncbi:MAG TPA: ABC transporter ATP-binding protein [Acidimicrobiales bacterium]|nr:ABC transporter ATP-binding protein [Acidimicrobiales bacterium]
MATTAGPVGGTIEVRGLTKTFGPVAAVQDLDFTVEPGRITGFLGPNGAGKTTTLRMLLGLVSPTSGTATIGGLRYRDIPEPVRVVGAVLEATSFHPGRRARNHLRMLTIAAGLPQERVDQVLEMVGLTGDANRRVGGYSLGMRQRLQLASALLGDPTVLLLDEPSNGLDPQGIAWLRDFLRHLAGQGRTVLVSSHLLAEMAQTVDDVVIVSKGRLRAQGPLSSLVGQAQTAMRVRTPEADRLVAVARAAGFSPRPVGPDTVIVDGVGPHQLGPVLAANQIVLYELVQQGQSLESLFLELTTSLGTDPAAAGYGHVHPGAGYGPDPAGGYGPGPAGAGVAQPPPGQPPPAQWPPPPQFGPPGTPPAPGGPS